MPNTRDALRTRLNNDLLDAIKTGDQIATMTLRSILDVMDNATAVPLTAEHTPVYGRSHEVPRKPLTDSDYQVILQNEADLRSVAAIEYERLGCPEIAARLRVEVNIVMSYIDV
jgi:uncharacterized protein YqeY